MRLRKLFALLIMLSVTACEFLPSPKANVTCPTKPVWTEAEIDHWSDPHVDYVFGVVDEGARLGCWPIDDEFGPKEN